MNYKVDGWNNFCRVFELPERYPINYCFEGGYPVVFQMIDWFNPIPGICQPAVTKKVWREEVGEIDIKEISIDELQESLIPWLLNKIYIKTNREYLVICDFGAVLRFNTKQVAEDI